MNFQVYFATPIWVWVKIEYSYWMVNTDNRFFYLPPGPEF